MAWIRGMVGSMLRRRLVLGLALLAALFIVLLYLFWGDEFSAVDRCLDHGGCWDYDTGQCVSEQRLCDDDRQS